MTFSSGCCAWNVYVSIHLQLLILSRGWIFYLFIFFFYLLGWNIKLFFFFYWCFLHLHRLEYTLLFYIHWVSYFYIYTRNWSLTPTAFPSTHRHDWKQYIVSLYIYFNLLMQQYLNVTPLNLNHKTNVGFKKWIHWLWNQLMHFPWDMRNDWFLWSRTRKRSNQWELVSGPQHLSYSKNILMWYLSTLNRRKPRVWGLYLHTRSTSGWQLTVVLSINRRGYNSTHRAATPTERKRQWPVILKRH